VPGSGDSPLQRILSAQTAGEKTSSGPGAGLESALIKSFGWVRGAPQNGLVERFIRSFKEECVWAHNFGSLSEARAEISKWID